MLFLTLSWHFNFKAVEPVNTKNSLVLLAFNLKNDQRTLPFWFADRSTKVSDALLLFKLTSKTVSRTLFFWFTYRNTNHAFLRALKSLNKLTAP